MVKDLKKINQITVNTWRWLKVNYADIEGINIPNKIYDDNSILLNEGIKKYIEDNYNNIEHVVSKFDNSDTNFGISKEVNEINNSNSNFKIIYIKENEKVVEPIIIDYTVKDENVSLMENINVVMGKYSEATILIKYDSDLENYIFHNGLLKIFADDSSKLNIIKVQTLNEKSLNFDSISIYAGYNAEINTSIINIGASKSIQSFEGNLIGDNSKLTLKNIYFGSRDNVLDMNYVMNHIGKKTNSSIIVKGALKDEAKKVFRGTIDFKKGAIKSIGEETENVIALSEKIKTDSVPILLCSEDDVSGNHSASVGKINEEKLFYLMSRGFSKKEAHKIIIEGEFSSIINSIPDEEITEKVINLIQRRLEND